MEIMKLEGYPTAVESEFEEEFGPSPFESKKNKIDGTIKIEDAVKMASDKYDPNDPMYKGINKKVVIEFIKEGIPLGYDTPEEYYDDFYGIIGKNKNSNIEDRNKDSAEMFKIIKGAAKGGIINLKKGGRARYQEGIGPIEGIDISINDNLLGSPDYQGGTTTSDVINQKETSSNNIQEMASSFLTDGMMDTNEALQTAITINKASEQEDFDKNLVLSLIKNGADLNEALQQAIMIAKGANVSQMKTGGRVKRNVGGIMDLGGMEKDYRFNGGFVPIGEYEKKDDVPARLSKNEFVFTADAVRAAGGGSINKGAKKMYDTMKTLEAQPTAKRMTA